MYQYFVREKRSGGIRVCVDLRHSNAAHKEHIDKYPLPLVADCLDSLAGKKWFPSLDVSPSFHQVPIHPDDRHKTSFCTRKGMFWYKKMPMGFSSSPATYARLRNSLLCGLLYDIVIAYVDDAVATACEFQEMLKNLQTVMDRFRCGN